MKGFIKELKELQQAGKKLVDERKAIKAKELAEEEARVAKELAEKEARVAKELAEEEARGPIVFAWIYETFFIE